MLMRSFQRLMHFRIRPQIDITVAVAKLNIGQPLPLGRRGEQRLGRHRESARPNRYLSGLCDAERAFDDDQIAQIEQPANFPPRGIEPFLAQSDLKVSAFIAQGEKTESPHVSLQHDASSPFDDGSTIGPHFSQISFLDLRQRLNTVLTASKRINPKFPQTRKLLSADVLNRIGWLLHDWFGRKFADHSCLPPN